MAHIKKYWLIMIVSVFFWCILNENFSLVTILIGIAVSLVANIVVALLFTDEEGFTGPYRLSFISLLRYIWVLFANIIKSAIAVIHIILFKDDTPMIITIKTDIHRIWPVCLIANGITLTPGTVTIDIKDNEITVLWLNPTTDDPALASKIILGHFENALITKEEKRC
jgi:multicomponent Na+:H+ antiporter subunit E